MISVKTNKSGLFKNHELLLGLEGLVNHVDHDVFVYLVKSLYRIVLYSGNLKETQTQLKKRITTFEKESLIPGFLSALSLNQLLIQLEDVQYAYPIHSKEITFPKFR